MHNQTKQSNNHTQTPPDTVISSFVTTNTEFYFFHCHSLFFFHTFECVDSSPHRCSGRSRTNCTTSRREWIPHWCQKQRRENTSRFVFFCTICWHSQKWIHTFFNKDNNFQYWICHIRWCLWTNWSCISLYIYRSCRDTVTCLAKKRIHLQDCQSCFQTREAHWNVVFWWCDLSTIPVSE